VAEPAQVRRRRAQLVLRRLIGPARRPYSHPVDIDAHHVGGEPIAYEVAVGRRFEPFAVGQEWGPAWDTTWFRVSGRVPPEWSGRAVALVVGLGYGGATGFGAEGMVWRGGEPLQGISPNHDEVVVAEPATGGEPFELMIEAAANPQVDSRTDPSPMYLPDFGGAPLLRLDHCHLAVVDREVEALWEDWSLLCELYDQLPPDEPRAAQILRSLDLAGRALDPEDVAGTAPAVRQMLATALAKRASESAHRYATVGNAHIDTAWLWPLRETERKAARTFSTAVSLMEDYPEYRFAASQAQQLAWIRDRYPSLYERIRKRVASGQFEVVGSMWVEADCNLPSGESLVRQIVHGKRFFAEEFGVDTRSLWLPDVFGYPANLPQILSLAGVRWFLTQKLSWNQVNRFPHHTFWWEGIDGSRILSHFPPADTYVGDMSMAQLFHGVRNFAQKELTDWSMYLFGWGDGGGGPTRHMLERARRLGDLEGAPRVQMTSTNEAFETIEANAPVDDLPVWVGELYLEMHRGTYTTHAEVKRGNRRLELALRDCELWSVAARPARDYPAAELDSAWKTLLLHQFHDIIPGSSINWVYRDTAAAYDHLADTTEAIIGGALGSVSRRVGAGAAEGPAEAAVLVANPLAFPRREVVDIDGAPHLVEAPSCGWQVQVPRTEPEGVAPVAVGTDWMSNGMLRVEWDQEGLLRSLVHLRSGREVLDGPGNVLQVHDDRPNSYDAWDIDAAAFDAVVELRQADSVEVVESGGLRAAVRVVRTYRHSVIEQLMVLRAGSPFVEFRTTIDWQEPKRLLKTAFPVRVHSPRATYEIQYGHLERTTHANTSWDAARFEVCAHTWADLSEPGFGVALLNDCKYGHDIRGNVMRLSLLRSPTWPDPVADRGRHEFVYAVQPHEGDVVSGGVIAAAHGLNSPLRVVPFETGPADGGPVDAGPPLPERFSLVEVDDPAVVVSAVKAPDDGGAGVVVRLYEAGGAHRRVRVRCGRATGGPADGPTARRVDLLEAPAESPVENEGGWAIVTLHPFEIVTLLFEG